MLPVSFLLLLLLLSCFVVDDWRLFRFCGEGRALMANRKAIEQQHPSFTTSGDDHKEPAALTCSLEFSLNDARK
uniref:Putative secreted protein n=1 Tax=Anopheles darlingi TaxID=43151 RepID=A0A2M4DGG1_ANODA